MATKLTRAQKKYLEDLGELDVRNLTQKEAGRLIAALAAGEHKVRWRSKPVTEAQKELLAELGFDLPPCGWTRGDAQRKIHELVLDRTGTRLGPDIPAQADRFGNVLTAAEKV